MSYVVGHAQGVHSAQIQVDGLGWRVSGPVGREENCFPKGGTFGDRFNSFERLQQGTRGDREVYKTGPENDDTGRGPCPMS